MNSQIINPDRRRFLGIAAAGLAAGAAQFLPSRLVAAAESEAIRPFRIDIPQSELDDLRRRIAETRWPDQETVTDGSQGNELATLQDIVRHWGTDYDWRKIEARLNALPMFMTEIDGLDIHFIHVRSRHENALPLIVTHGWPGSIIEQLKIIDPAHQPDGAWRRRIGCLPSGDPLAAGLRFLRQAQREGLESRSHRARLGRN